MPVLGAPPLTLVPITEAHADAMLAQLNDPDIRRLTGTHGAFTQEQVAHFCARVASDPNRFDYAICVDDVALGEIVLNELDHDNRCANLRIALWASTHMGHGIGSAAMKLLIRFGFEEVRLNRIELNVFSFNQRALRTFDRLGFVGEGIRRSALIWDGSPYDAIAMAMLRSDDDSHAPDW